MGDSGGKRVKKFVSILICVGNHKYQFTQPNISCPRAGQALTFYSERVCFHLPS
ncbi:hypothetical protein LX69_00969 [Breznakibacter xylanolyticus]|uniref:Uncharacterized protein n=1 Tax=Breznakibacter xylanolyticus TaxID=990 RepID=A0A2W7NZC0_9BACT|nr:hypothetical protein LX69_00969 [Breznakibacter xylanolyticus]